MNGNQRISFEEELRAAKEQAPVKLPPDLGWEQFNALEIEKPKPIIHGVFDAATRMIVAGGSKTFKSWLLSDMAASVCCGLPWWGFETAQGAIIYCNFELQSHYCRQRFRSICKAKDAHPTNGNLRIWNLRGSNPSLEAFKAELIARIVRTGAILAIVDPFYRLLGERNELYSSDIMPIMLAFEQINVQTGAAVVCGAHFSKGNQASKDPLDRISGGSALNRHPDCLLTLTRHEEDQAFTVDLICRDFPPIAPFVVKWQHPLLLPEPQLDPAKLKAPKLGRAKTYTEAQIIEVLRAHDDEFSTTELQAAVSEETGMSTGKFYELWTAIKKQKKVWRSKISQKWNLQLQ